MILPSNIFPLVIFLHSWGFLTWASGDNIALAPNRSFKIAAQRGHQHFPFGLRGDDGLNSLSLLIEVFRLTALGWV